MKNINDNRGFSLVELIVVILIMAIVGGGATVGIMTMYSADAKKCTTIISSELSNARIQAMTKSQEVTVYIHEGETGKYYIDIIYDDDYANPYESERITSKATIQYMETATSPATDIPAGGIKLAFDRGSGAFNFTSGTFNKCYCIIVTASNVSTVYLVEDTGRNYVE